MGSRGYINFSVRQNKVEGGTQLFVTILNCKGLPNLDDDGTLTDPYVKVFVLPGEELGIRTDTIKDDLNPIFNRQFSFMLVGQYKERELVLQVLDSDDHQKEDDRVGEARLNLKEGYFYQETRHTKQLELFYLTPPQPQFTKSIKIVNASVPNYSRFENRGRIYFNVLYMNVTNEIQIDVRKCENLPNMDLGSLSDPYVIVSILSGAGEALFERRTRVIRDNLSPKFHEKFKFPISKHEVENKIAMFQVYDWDDNDTNGDFIGEFSLDITLGQLSGDKYKFVQELRKFY